MQKDQRVVMMMTKYFIKDITDKEYVVTMVMMGGKYGNIMRE